MKLQQVFPDTEHGYTLLRDKANGYDASADFVSAVQKKPVDKRTEILFRVAQEVACDLDEAAGKGICTISEIPPQRIIWAGQQAYIDYSLGVAAKVDALESMSDSVYTFFCLVDYDFIQSDPFISRIVLPRILAGASRDPLLRLRLHPKEKNKFKDMRFVQPPDQKKIFDIHGIIKETLNNSSKILKGKAFDKWNALRSLEALVEDYEFARNQSRNVGEFNAIWTVRMFRRLKFTVPFVPVIKLLQHEDMVGAVASTLSRILRENTLFVESINDMVSLAGEAALGIKHQEEGYLPLYMTDSITGFRFPVRCVRKGADYYIVSSRNFAFEDSVGAAADQDILEFLSRNKGYWSPNIFLPLFLNRMGPAGSIIGRSSIKYTVVLAHVMERFYGEKAPPSLLCAGSVPPDGILHQAFLKQVGQLPASVAQLEPSLVYKYLFNNVDEVRQDIAETWRNQPDTQTESV